MIGAVDAKFRPQIIHADKQDIGPFVVAASSMRQGSQQPGCSEPPGGL